jgi:hypothetical protein
MVIWVKLVDRAYAVGYRGVEQRDGTNPSSIFLALTSGKDGRYVRSDRFLFPGSAPRERSEASDGILRAGARRDESHHAVVAVAGGRSASCPHQLRQLPFPVHDNVRACGLAARLPIWQLPGSHHSDETGGRDGFQDGRNGIVAWVKSTDASPEQSMGCAERCPVPPPYLALSRTRASPAGMLLASGIRRVDGLSTSSRRRGGAARDPQSPKKPFVR